MLKKTPQNNQSNHTNSVRVQQDWLKTGMSDTKFWYNKPVPFITPDLEFIRFDFGVEDQMLIF